MLSLPPPANILYSFLKK